MFRPRPASPAPATRPAACAALGALALVCCGQPRTDSVLLVSIDTLRADHVGAYGHRNDTTPALDRLAARGVRFEDATVQWPKTWPSMASMLTGTYPATTGVRMHAHVLAESNRTLAEILGEAGLRTAAVVTNLNIGEDFGFDQGFETFVESWEEALVRETGSRDVQGLPGVVKEYTDARVVTDQALAWIDSLAAGERWFLWLHYMEPHGPYRPPRGYGERFAGSYPSETVEWSELPMYQRRYDPETGLMMRDLADYEALYDGEIRFLDDELGRLLDRLAERGRLEGTLVVVTADHGESLDEHHYYLEHGRLPYQSTARVPLLLVQEGRLPEGRVVREPVALIDLAPTILELLGIEPPAQMAGRSLVPALRGEALPPRPVFMESGDFEPTQLTVREGRWKLVHYRSPEDRAQHERPEFELYDLRADPAEQRDVIHEHPERAAALRAALREWQRTTPVADPGTRPEPPELAEDARRLLRALGYLEAE
jgi:arylsulfatase A-like enzyme